MEVHWQTHVAERWDSDGLTSEAKEALIRELVNDRPIGVPPGAGAFFDCRWYRDPEMEELTELADAIAEIRASIPRCIDGTYSNKQIHEVSPSVGCPLEVIQLIGDFPPAQEPAVTILFPTSNGYQNAEIVTWAADIIEIRVPANALPGCVWFADSRKREEYQECLRSGPQVLKQGLAALYSPEKTDGVLTVGTLTSVMLTSLIALFFEPQQTRPDDLPCFPESGAFFAGSAIEIRDLTINGRQVVRDPETGELLIQTDSWIGRPISLEFTAVAAEHLHLCAWTSDDGYTFHTELDPTASSYQLTSPNVDSGTRLTVRVFGWNRCSDRVPLLAPLDQLDPCSAGLGTAAIIPVVTSVEGMVRLRAQPQLSITGVEVTQAIQRFSVTTPDRASNNSVELIRRRTTVFRVYVDSGIAGGGPLARVPVVGTLQLPDGVSIQSWGTGLAQPTPDINRETTQDAVNFVVPGFWLDRSSCSISTTPRHYGALGDERRRRADQAPAAIERVRRRTLA
jgi:hypothetical protein